MTDADLLALMKPVAAKEVKAARGAGLYANTASAMERGKRFGILGNAAIQANGGRPSKHRANVMSLILDGKDTTADIHGALGLAKSNTILRDMCARGEIHRVGKSQYAITDAGRALLAKEAANG